jgi:hypothetical protein
MYKAGAKQEAFPLNYQLQQTFGRKYELKGVT